MHLSWTSYLNAQHLSAQLPTEHQSIIAPLTHLAVLTLSGQDAASFLQGQTTCNINELVDSVPQLGAYCNAKGRTITTFMIIKQESSFHLLLPRTLLESTRKKLQMYVLRAKVQITDQSDCLSIIGVHNISLRPQSHLYPYPQQDNSFLFIAEPEQACSFWSELIADNTTTAVNADAWLGLDILAGIPWLNTETTEKFVPQMLNLDKLNAISFEKGCYTGQEIVARTHYLGQNKRAMYLASCAPEAIVMPGCEVVEMGNDDNKLGAVVLAATFAQSCQLLVVLKDQAGEIKNLQLNNQNKDKITLNQGH